VKAARRVRREEVEKGSSNWYLVGPLPYIVLRKEPYELVRAKGQVGYIAGRREKGAFVIKDEVSGKKLLEVTPRIAVRIARPTQGWMMIRQLVPDWIRKEGGASSPR